MRPKPLLMCCFLLLAGVFGVVSFAAVPNVDRELSLLRGSWEYHTFYDKWNLIFQTDRAMIFNDTPARYQLLPGVIRIEHEEGTNHLSYRLEGDELVITWTDGSTRSYRRTGPGPEEELIHGRYTSSAGEYLSFDGDHTFTLSARSGRSVDSPHLHCRGGLYRVNGELIVLAFDDGGLLELPIRERRDDWTAAGILYRGNLFETREPVYVEAVPVVEIAPPPPAPASSLSGLEALLSIFGAFVSSPEPSDWGPKPVIVSVPEPAGSSQPAPSESAAASPSAPAKPQQTHRDFGSTRGRKP